MELCSTRLSQAHFVYIHSGCSVKYSVCMLHSIVIPWYMHDYVALLHVFKALFFVINLCLFDVCSGCNMCSVCCNIVMILSMFDLYYYLLIWAIICFVHVYDLVLTGSRFVLKSELVEMSYSLLWRLCSYNKPSSAVIVLLVHSLCAIWHQLFPWFGWGSHVRSCNAQDWVQAQL